MKVAIIGQGAIGTYVMKRLASSTHVLCALLVRPERVVPDGNVLHVGSVDALPGDTDIVIDCAGHSALTAYGPDILRRGVDLITVSLGALADDQVYAALHGAALEGRSRLHLAGGAIGALDCLRAARAGHLESVTYTGRKPPQGWAGSAAEQVLDLQALGTGAAVHFDGTARKAALRYPKNANVAAAVALAGLGFDATKVSLIADADITTNIHEVEAQGDFGSFTFQISGKSLPDNPRSSALAAMSVLSKLDGLTQPVSL